MAGPVFKRLLRHLSTAATAALSPAPAPAAPSSSLAVQFLIDGCGLSRSAAATTAGILHLHDDSLSIPRSVLSLLRSHGFSPSQISTLVSARPSILRSDPDRFLGPKLHLLASAAGDRLPDIVCINPTVLTRNIDNHLRPTLDLLRSLSPSPEDLHLAVRRNRWLLTCNLHGNLLPNVALLLDHGVPAAHISKLLTMNPTALLQNAARFAEAVQTVEGFGFRPELSLFVHAVRTICGMHKSRRDSRLAMLRTWGWSDGEISAAFRRAPLFLLVSAEKMRRAVDFFVNTVGYEHGYLSQHPKLLMYALEKRIMPRFAVFRVLELNGLAQRKKRDNKVSPWLFVYNERIFLDQYVTRFRDKVPELLDVYRGKIGVEAFNSKDV